MTVRLLLLSLFFLGTTVASSSAGLADESRAGLPEGMHGFNGLLVGKLIARDVEKGTLTLRVDRVSRVWRNSKAKKPKSAVGKSVEIEGVFGKWLDSLLLVKKGETLELEARHDGGARLTFPGELLRKVAAVKPGDYPELPDAFRGFEGAVACKVIRKDDEMLEAIVEVTKVLDVWKKNRAEKPKSIVGKRLVLAGFWNRKEFYQGMKAGDRLETGLRHHSIQSDHLSVLEFVRKGDGKSTRESSEKVRADEDEAGAFPKGLRGFSGMLVGRLLEKDVERGSFRVVVDRVARVWRNNKARDPKSVVGKGVAVEGVTGKWLDVLLLAKKGDTIQFEAAHDGRDKLRFPGELLRKVPAVKPGDFPELPEGARGFRGRLSAKVVKKDAEGLEVIVEILEISESGETNKAKKAGSLVGKRVMLGGFWPHKKFYSALRVGDVIEGSVRHTVWHTDHLSLERTPAPEKRGAEGR